jgi:tetratricopeptide (TPR) repeat protein
VIVFNLIAGDTARASALRAAHSGSLKPEWRRVVDAVRAVVAGNCVPASRLASRGADELGPGRATAEFLHYLAATCQLDGGNPAAAISELRAIVDAPLLNPDAAPIYPCAYFQLGRAYEAAGDAKRARSAYQTLLAMWKDGDEDLPFRLQARARLRALESAM